MSDDDFSYDFHLILHDHRRSDAASAACLFAGGGTQVNKSILHTLVERKNVET